MHGLVGEVLRTHCSLAGTEEGQQSIGNRLSHDLLHLQRFTVMEDETAFQGIIRILVSVASKVDNVAPWQVEQYIPYGRRIILDTQPDQRMAWHMLLDVLKLLFGVR